MLVIHACTYVYGEGPTNLETVRRFGAIQTGDTAATEWYRSITYIFVHIGGHFHLLSNVACLIILGPTLEKILGSFKFTLVYLITGMFGGLFVLIFSTNVIAAGASGSLFGLLGVYIGLMIRKKHLFHAESRDFIVGYLIYSIIYTFAIPGISIAGHFGGLFGGLLISLFIRPQPFLKKATTVWWKESFQTLLVLCLPLVIIYLPNYLQPTTFIHSIEESLEALTEINLDSLSNQLDFNSIDLPVFNDTSKELTAHEIKKDVDYHPRFEIQSIESGVLSGWIDTTEFFYNEILVTINITNRSQNTVTISPDMFILTDTGGHQSSLMPEALYDSFLLEPDYQVTLNLSYAVQLKTTTSDFILSVPAWDSNAHFNLSYGFN
ncbi:hypothetical protein BTS2_1916 [Bacillus sp. TS-2]|nr:hypothetical protein BTS2_1916 [Bacillus sp. TS-2]